MSVFVTPLLERNSQQANDAWVRFVAKKGRVYGLSLEVVDFSMGHQADTLGRQATELALHGKTKGSVPGLRPGTMRAFQPGGAALDADEWPGWLHLPTF